jgi:hypothetical protein
MSVQVDLSSIIALSASQANTYHCQQKQEAAHSAATAWLHATMGRAWRSWRMRVHHSVSKRGAAAAAVVSWRNALAARCWRAWAERAAHRQLLTQRATSFIRELSAASHAIAHGHTAAQPPHEVPQTHKRRISAQLPALAAALGCLFAVCGPRVVLTVKQLPQLPGLLLAILIWCHR